MTGGDEPGGGGDPPCWAHLFEGPDGEAPTVIDLGNLDTDGADGAVWSLPHGGDLDANLVRLHAGGAIAPHVNNEVDVLLFVQSGSGELLMEGHRRPLRSDVLALVPRGAERAISAGAQGITYLSVHRRANGLTIIRPPATAPVPGLSRAAPVPDPGSQVTE